MNGAADMPGTFHPASSPDYVPREHLQALQSQRLRQVVARVYEHVPLYRQRMHKATLTPADICQIDDIRRLPFTTPEDLRDTYPLGMLAVPAQRVARWCAARSAAGKPLALAYSRCDLEASNERVVRCLACCGIHRGDVLLSVWAYHLLAEALALHAGAEALGATVVPAASSDADHQLALLKDFSVSAVCAPPGALLRLAEHAERTGTSLRELPLRVAVFLGEAPDETIRRRIEERTGIKGYHLFGLPEVLGPALGTECPQQNGFHLFEDHFYPEVVDPSTGEPLPEGQEGHLVLTTLTWEAMPLLRFRTLQRAMILAGPCACGRTLRRIERVGRPADEVFAIEGVGISRTQIEAVLQAVEGTLPPCQVVRTQHEGLDQLEVQIEVTPQIFQDQVGALERLQSKLADQIERSLGVRVPVRFVEPHSIQRSAAALRRV